MTDRTAQLHCERRTRPASGHSRTRPSRTAAPTTPAGLREDGDVSDSGVSPERRESEARSSEAAEPQPFDRRQPLRLERRGELDVAMLEHTQRHRHDRVRPARTREPSAWSPRLLRVRSRRQYTGVFSRTSTSDAIAAVTQPSPPTGMSPVVAVVARPPQRSSSPVAARGTPWCRPRCRTSAPGKIRRRPGSSPVSFTYSSTASASVACGPAARPARAAPPGTPPACVRPRSSASASVRSRWSAEVEDRHLSRKLPGRHADLRLGGEFAQRVPDRRVDPGAAHVDRRAAHIDRVQPPADAVAGFEHDRLHAGGGERVGGGQPGDAGSITITRSTVRPTGAGTPGSPPS